MCLVFLSAKYKTEELEVFIRLMKPLLYWHRMNNPFLTALLLTENDINLQTQQRVGTIITQAPTFKNASDVIIEMKEKDFCSLRVSV
jgi:hypothetical protein